MKNNRSPIDLSWFVSELGSDVQEKHADKPVFVDDIEESLGDTATELREAAANLKKLARSKSISVSQKIQIQARLGALLAALARCEGRKLLEEHPDYESHIEHILDALDATLRSYGLDPNEARLRWADEHERLEGERKRRAT